MSSKIRIYGELENHTENGFVTDASQVRGYDVSGTAKSQALINSDVYERIGRSIADTSFVVCNSEASENTKEVILTEGYGWKVSESVRVLIKMTNTNTADEVKLSINDESLPLYYNGRLANSGNTWAAGEVLDIYCDQISYNAITFGAAQFKSGEKVRDIMIESIPTRDSENLVSSGGLERKFSVVDADLLALNQAVFPLVATLSTPGVRPTQEYTGENVNITLSWSTSREGKGDVIAERVIVKKGSETIGDFNPPQNPAGTIPTFINNLGSTTFTALATLDGMEYQVEKVFTQYLPSYIGFYESGHTVNEMAVGDGRLGKMVISNPKELSGGPYPNTKANAYFTICLPNTFSNPIRVVDAKSGFEIPMQNAVPDTSVVIGGNPMNYLIYRSASQINQGSSLSITLIY